MAAVVLLAVSAALVYGFSLINNGSIFPNVHISGVDVGGMTYAQADELLQKELSVSEEDYTLTVKLPDRDLVFRPEIKDERVDTAMVLDAAMAYGRQNGPFTAIKTYRNSKDVPYELSIETHIPIDEEAFREKIDKAAAAVKQEKVQSEVTMDEENELLTVKLGYNGRKLNADALYERVLEA